MNVLTPTRERELCGRVVDREGDDWLAEVGYSALAVLLCSLLSRLAALGVAWVAFRPAIVGYVRRELAAGALMSNAHKVERLSALIPYEDLRAVPSDE